MSASCLFPHELLTSASEFSATLLNAYLCAVRVASRPPAAPKFDADCVVSSPEANVIMSKPQVASSSSGSGAAPVSGAEASAGVLYEYLRSPSRIEESKAAPLCEQSSRVVCALRAGMLLRGVRREGEGERGARVDDGPEGAGRRRRARREGARRQRGEEAVAPRAPPPRVREPAAEQLLAVALLRDRLLHRHQRPRQHRGDGPRALAGAGPRRDAGGGGGRRRRSGGGAAAEPRVRDAAGRALPQRVRSARLGVRRALHLRVPHAPVRRARPPALPALRHEHHRSGRHVRHVVYYCTVHASTHSTVQYSTFEEL